MENQKENSPLEPTLQQNYQSQHNISSQPQQQRPSLNADEQKAYRECIKETFYYRCIPFSFIGSSIAYMGLKAGYLKVNPRFGFVPKMMGAAFIGFVLGRLSYQDACAEKFMKLPNSPIGEALRKRKSQVESQESFSPESGSKMDEKSDGLPNQNPTFKDHQPNLPNLQEGLNDYNQVMDGLTPALSNSGPDGSNPYYSSPSPEGPSQSHESPSTISDNSSLTNFDYSPAPIPGKEMKKNKYGDDVYV